MERLWSPWRLAYVTGAKDPQCCIFCDALTRTETEPLILFRGSACFVILNLFPYNNGHLLIAPNRHVATLAGLTRDESIELMALTQRAECVLTEAYQPEGVNVGANLGRPAGAGIVDHVHMHLVPRWTGDTSFMSVIGEVRVLPETLEATATRLRPIFERLGKEATETEISTESA
jgi:ATP adenylyltransferase